MEYKPSSAIDADIEYCEAFHSLYCLDLFLFDFMHVLFIVFIILVVFCVFSRGSSQDIREHSPDYGRKQRFVL